MKTSGPAVALNASCANCQHCESEYYCIEDGNDCDSSNRVYCAEPSVIAASEILSRRRIGDTTWSTPSWCPLLADAIAAVHGARP